MFEKRNVSFPVEGGVELAAWLFVPEQHDVPLPAITMSHGFAGTRYHGIEPFAEAFAKAGFVVLVHDHRNFGDSGGLPRQDINPWQQIDDWRRAISWLQTQPEVDANRIGIWGTSFSGGHAIVLGATDRRLKAVVTQAPTVDGHASGLRRVPAEIVADLEARFAADDQAQLAGAAPVTQQIVSNDPAVPAAYRAPDAVSFYLQTMPEGVWENRLSLRSTRWARMYSPGVFIDRVSPTPLLMLVAERDHIAPTDLALKAYEQALEPKRLVMLKGGHFDPYLAELPTSSGEALEWFKRYL